MHVNRLSAPTAPTDDSLKRWLLIVYAVLVIFRLWLSGDRDILATNSPYDEFWYIASASRNIWGGGYDHMAFSQMPIYSSWLLALKLMGIPARLGIDIFWVVSSLYLAITLSRLTRQSLTGLFVFVLLIFHPYSFFLFDRALTETLLATLSLCALAACMDVWLSRNARSVLAPKAALWIFVVTYALAYFTRKEGVVLLVPLLTLAAISLLSRKAWWTQPFKQCLGFNFILAPLLAVLFVGLSIATINYVKIGLFVNNELSASGYQRAIKSLNSIDVGRTPRHATVTKAARALAYEVSPTFKELQPFFDGEPGQQLAANPQIGVEGEIGNGWFYWAFRDAGAYAGWFTKAKHADKKYAAIADELNQAFANGKLIKRPFVVSSFVDPDFGKWVGLVPGSSLNLLGLLVAPEASRVSLPIEDATPSQLKKYITITGRRSLEDRYTVGGWVAAPGGSVMAFGGVDVPTTWVKISDSRRSDIGSEAYSFELNAPRHESPTSIYLKDPQNHIFRIAIAQLQLKNVAILKGDSGSFAAGIEDLTLPDLTTRLDTLFGADQNRKGAIHYLYTVYEIIGWLGCVLIAIACLICLFGKRTGSPVFIALLATVSLIVARSLMLGILDASSWTGMQIRYVFPAVPFFFAAIGLAMACVMTTRKQIPPHP
jgi:hypothetical protein